MKSVPDTRLAAGESRILVEGVNFVAGTSGTSGDKWSKINRGNPGTGKITTPPDYLLHMDTNTKVPRARSHQ